MLLQWVLVEEWVRGLVGQWVLLECCAVVHADVAMEAGPGSRSKVSNSSQSCTKHFIHRLSSILLAYIMTRCMPCGCATGLLAGVGHACNTVVALCILNSLQAMCSVPDFISMVCCRAGALWSLQSQKMQLQQFNSLTALR